MNRQKYTTVTALLITALLLLSTGKSYPQSSDQNYTVTKTYTQKAGTTSIDSIVKIDYYDGLGRPVQTVRKQFTPAGKDLVTRQEYDNFGRASKAWLPINNGNNTGNFDNTTNVSTGYNGDTYAYSETKYEPSPLNRVDEQYGPGKEWRDNTRRVKTEYLTNTASGDYSCAYYFLQDPWTLKKSGNYTANQLYVTKTTDEDNNISYEFRDKLGRVLLQRQMDGTTQYNTYYVYDDFGNLCYVMPPVLSDAMANDGTYDANGTVNNISIFYNIFSFYYDYRNRMINKKIPNSDVEMYAYDKADRLVMTQTAKIETPAGRGWLFNKYDGLGRLILTGIYHGEDNSAKSSNQRADEMRSYFQNNNILSKESISSLASDSAYYTWTSFPTDKTQSEVTQVNYYDDYVTILKWDANLNFISKSGYDAQYTSAKGLLTGTRSRLLNGVKYNNGWINTAYYYDYKGNIVQKRSNNQLGGYDNEYYACNYNSLVTRKCIEHSSSTQSLTTEVYDYEYDAQLRLKTVKYTFNGKTVPMAEYAYNELGQVSGKTVGGLEKTDYKYNIRGWEESGTGPRFEEKLSYTSNISSTGKKYFGGNIASLTWRTPTVTNLTDTRGYAFEYDALGRLRNAAYGEGATLIPGTKNYSESFTYDKQGNLLSLQRYGRSDNGTFLKIDDLVMPASSYMGNMRYKPVTDTGWNMYMMQWE